MTRWTVEEDTTLRELAQDGLSAREISLALNNRSESAVSGRASRLEVTLDSRAHQTLREHLGAGGYVVRDDVGGAVGEHWTTASRSGGVFSPVICGRYLKLGFIIPAGRENVFRWAAPC